MLNILYLTAFLLVLLTITNSASEIDEIDYFDNDLAKVCRPVDRPLDILFVLDGSGSAEGSTFDLQLQMLNRVIDMVDIGDEKTRIGVMQYASYTYVEFIFKAYKDKVSLREAVKGIRHKLGTTKTGKALDKALQIFTDSTSGSRHNLKSKKQQNVAQVVIIVSDGHSHDDPVSASLRLKKAGIHMMALAIGSHINSNELLQMTGDKDLIFYNLTKPESAAHFTETLRMRFAITESCEYSRGLSNNGADIHCGANGVNVSVTTRAPFHGHFYVKNQFNNANCRWNQSSLTNFTYGGENIPTNISNEGGSELNLSINFNECGFQHQFSVNPKAILFQVDIILQFHPIYSTEKDKMFKLQCFYNDKSGDVNDEIDWELIKEHTQRKAKKNKTALPCAMQIINEETLSLTELLSSNETNETNDCSTAKLTKFFLGNKIRYQWECNSDNFDTYQSMLVHNCYLVDLKTNHHSLIIDENGCSLEPRIIETPRYHSSLVVTSHGVAIRRADSSFIKLKCSLRFCDRLMSECDEILPPKCKSKKPEATVTVNKNNEKLLIEQRRKRQVGVPISIRSLGAITDKLESSPPLVTFDRNKLEKNKLSSKRRINALVGQQNVVALINSSLPTKNSLHTQKINKEIGENDNSSTPSQPILNFLSKNFEISSINKDFDDDDNELQKQFKEQNILLIQKNINDNNKIIKNNKAVSEDPFQEELQKMIKENESNSKLAVADLNVNLLATLNLNIIEVESQTINVQDTTLPTCNNR